VSADLVLYDAARAAIQKAVRVDEAKTIRDKGVAMRAYARQSKDVTMKLNAVEIIERATRRLGELIAAQKALPREKGGGLARGGGEKGVGRRGKNAGPNPTRIPLSDMGIDKHLADEARRLAAIEEREFEARLKEAREQGEKKQTSSTVLSLTRKADAAKPAEPVETPGFPDGPFRAIVIDPPWPIEKIVLERRPVESEAMDYATMTLDEIRELPIKRLADPRGAHVYLWVTHKFLPTGLELFSAWGIRYECLLTWIKPTAQPLWWMFNTEHVLFGKVASLTPLVKGSKVGFTAPQQRHSHKPDEFFELARKVSPGPRLTMFDGPREGFEAWGIPHTPTS
jgi:N6-adenosine-specific RNA methylase IME4